MTYNSYKILKQILADLSPREREALRRFYTLGQDSTQIAHALGLNEDELKKLKTRVRNEFLRKRPPP